MNNLQERLFPRREIHFLPAKSASTRNVQPVHSSKDPKGASNDKGIFPATLVTKYLKWNSIHSIGPGFFNEGNTCFLNSTLQCLLYVPSFTQVLLNERSAALKVVDSNRSDRAVIELYTNLVREIWHGTSRKVISPKSMIACIRRVGKQFRPFRQEDAHEYLRQLLDYMHEEVIRSHGFKCSDGKRAETSAISRVFGGYMSNTLSCTRCSYKSKTQNHFQDISLELRQGIQSISDAILAFTRIENLTQGNEWMCDGCKQRVKATKQLMIDEPPNVLVLHLKRFSFGNMSGKISRHVDFSEILKIPISDGSSCNYQLTGVVVHHGHSSHSGHYIAYVKAPNGQWHEMNDSIVSVVSVKKVLGSQAYILFYSRIPPVSTAEKDLLNQPTDLCRDDNIVKSAQNLSLASQARVDSPTQSNITYDENDDDRIVFRMRLPLRFKGILGKFKRWKVRKFPTDLRILGRICHQLKLHRSNISDQNNFGGTTKTDSNLLTALLDESRRGRSMGSEGLWDNITPNQRVSVEQISTQQRRGDQVVRKRSQLSEWDRQLDLGKVKKMKKSSDFENETSDYNPFQLIADGRKERPLEDFRGLVKKHRRF